MRPSLVALSLASLAVLGAASLAAAKDDAADDIRDGEWMRTGGKGGLDCSKPAVTIALLLVGGSV